MTETKQYEECKNCFYKSCEKRGNDAAYCFVRYLIYSSVHWKEIEERENKNDTFTSD